MFLYSYYSFNFDCKGKMIPNEKMVYVLTALIFVISLVYFVVAWQAIGELAEAKSNDEKLGSNMEISLFSVVACSYLLMGVWIIKKEIFDINSLPNSFYRFCNNDWNLLGCYYRGSSCTRS